MAATDEKRVPLGRIGGAHGVKGWVNVHSYTEPRENIAQFRTWILDQGGAERRVGVESCESRGKSVVVKLAGIDDRDAAQALAGAAIAVERAALPPIAPGEYYWADLEGLTVRTLGGEVLGTIDHLVATGAHDVLVLGGPGPRMIPFAPGRIVRGIDLEAGIVLVDWDRSYWE